MEPERTTNVEVTDLEKAYFENIDNCALKAIDCFIKNSQPNHARYLMQKMFDVASNQIFLYSGHLVRQVDEQKIYADSRLIESMKRFLRLKDGPSLKIAIQHEVDGGVESHPLVVAIEELKKSGELNGSVEIRKVDSDVENHFMVMDDNAYRLEKDHEPCNAIANFNDKKTAKQINLFFDPLFQSGEFLYQA